jgi:ABC-2 type transport system ATP-binding protein
MPGIMEIHKHDSVLSLEAGDMVTTTSINQYCFDKGIVLSHLNLKRKSLEKRFLEITGGKSDR